MGLPGDEENPWPSESHEEGCPASWYRSVFASSVRRYKGPHGRLATDRLILDALEYLEAEENRAREHRQ